MSATGWVVVAAGAAALAVWVALGRASLRRLRPLRVRVRGRPGRGLPAWVGTREEARRQGQVEAGVPLVCDLLAVCLGAGLPLRGALRVVAEVSDPATRDLLEGVWNQIDLGIDEARAWRSLGEADAYRGVARDLARSLDAGTGLVELLGKRAVEARAAHATTLRSRARRVSVTGVLPMVVCYLPAFLLVGVVPIIASALLRALGGG